MAMAQMKTDSCPHEPECDELLMSRVAVDGDGQAFDELCRRWESRLQSALRRWRLEPEIIEELSQESLMKVWRSRGDWLAKVARADSSFSFAKWICRIARNAGYDATRRRSQEAEHTATPPPPGAENDDLLDNWIEGLPHDDDDPLEIAVKQAIRDALAQCVKRLPDRERNLLRNWIRCEFVLTDVLRMSSYMGELYSPLWQELKRSLKALRSCMASKGFDTWFREISRN
jgi:RNA polymerase sigma-70 factor (ECF subfamily)